MIKNCAGCGAKFETDSALQDFCSRHCLEIYYRQQEQALQNDLQYEKVCPTCGKTFQTFYSCKKYCSDRCRQVASCQRLKEMQEQDPTLKEKRREYARIYKKKLRALKQNNAVQQRKQNEQRNFEKEAAQCGMTYGKYRAAVEIFGKTFEELKKAYEDSKSFG